MVLKGIEPDSKSQVTMLYEIKSPVPPGALSTEPWLLNVAP